MSSLFQEEREWGISNIKSGVTDDIEEQFEWLYKRFVDGSGQGAGKAAPKAEERMSAIQVVERLIGLLSRDLKRQPSITTFDYKATGGKYRFDVSFGSPDNIYMKVLEVQIRRERKTGTPDFRNILRAVAVLSAMEREHPGFTFGIILHVPSGLSAGAVQKAVGLAQSMIEDSGLDFVVANRGDMEAYFRIKKLLR